MSSDLLRGTAPRVGKRYFRDVGIPAYLYSEEAIEKAAHYAGHRSPRTTQVYDKRREVGSADYIAWTLLHE